MKNNFVIINLLNYVTDDVMDLKLDLLTDRLTEIKNNNQHALICHFVENYCWGYYIYEKHNHDLILLDNLRQLLKEYDIKYHFLFDALYEGQHKIDNTDDIIFVNYAMLLTYDFIFLRNNKFNTKWEPNNKKGLFLCGKGSKVNRAFLLRKLYQNDLLDSFTWSFNNNKKELDIIRQDFADYTDEQWNKFLEDCTRNLDLSSEYIEKNNFFQHDGFPVDVSLYNNNLYSLISETHFSEKLVRIGEKTWRTIINNHPFLMAGCFRTLVELRKMGFKTFDNYAEIKTYDLAADSDERINLIVENCKSFMTNLHNNQTEVQKDITYNYHKLLEYCMLYSNRLTKTLDCSEHIVSQIIYEFKLP